MVTVDDAFWIWGHEAGSHNKQYGLKGISRMTPTEGALYLGARNLVMVRYEGKPAPPFEQYALALSSLKRVVWSIVGAGGVADPNEAEMVLSLARRFPNIDGVQMDDFFYNKPDDHGRVAVYDVGELRGLKERLTVGGRRLDLWVTLYTSNLELPGIEKHLNECDVVNYWTWRAEDLKHLEGNFLRLEQTCERPRKLLGCYMWDYGDQRPMPVSLMEHQCRLGLEWMKRGRIEGMIFLASCICDLGLDAVEWTRKWIREVRA